MIGVEARRYAATGNIRVHPPYPRLTVLRSFALVLLPNKAFRLASQ